MFIEAFQLRCILHVKVCDSSLYSCRESLLHRKSIIPVATGNTCARHAGSYLPCLTRFDNNLFVLTFKNSIIPCVMVVFGVSFTLFISNCQSETLRNNRTLWTIQIHRFALTNGSGLPGFLKLGPWRQRRLMAAKFI